MASTLGLVPSRALAGESSSGKTKEKHLERLQRNASKSRQNGGLSRFS